MKLVFVGAAHEVTGSCTLLHAGDRNYLIDCGMEQGKDIFENVDLPIAANEVDAVFLTHAHIDHSGLLPKLYKDGFKGVIYSTEATKDLCSVMLLDSAHIQEAEAAYHNRKAQRSGAAPVEVLYDTGDAQGAVKLFKGCDYGKVIKVSDFVSVRFNDVGHLLGSAFIEVWVTENGVSKKIIFSGDVGNTDHPIINDPKSADGADYVIIESTYGNRYHESQHNPIYDFAEIIQRTFDRGGNVVIPSFAVGRTQEMLYLINEIKDKGLVTGHDGFPVYVDSPLAAEATEIFSKCDISYFDKEMKDLLQSGINPLWNNDIVLSVTADESKSINADSRPKIILSASGMCEAGRIRHHLKHNLWCKESTVLFVGYQSEASLGRLLQNGAESVKLFGEEIAVKAEIASLNGTSGHADKKGLLNWLNGMKQKPEKVFVNHGDNESCEDFKNCLANEYGYDATAPYSGTEFDLVKGEITLQTEGVPIKKSGTTAGGMRAQNVYDNLITAATSLLYLAKSYKGFSNKEIQRFTRDIKSLEEKYKF